MSLLWVDTSAALGTEFLTQLSELAQSKHVSVVIHPQVYLEMRRRMQARCTKRAFDPVVFDSFLEVSEIQVFEMQFTRFTAAGWADRLFGRYPTEEKWLAAKKATLGGELLKGFSVPPGQMPMTTDWLIALQVEDDPESFVVTHDQGEEWKALRAAQPQRVFTKQEAVAWLQRLPG